MIPPIRLETSGDVLSTMDMVMQQRDNPRRLRDDDDHKKLLPSTFNERICKETDHRKINDKNVGYKEPAE